MKATKQRNSLFIKENKNNKEPDKKIVPPSNVGNVSNSITNKILANKDILDLFPETNIIIQVVTSSIISPQDYRTVNMLYGLPNTKLPSEVKNLILTDLKSYINKVYDIEKSLFEITSETLFTKGSYCEAFIPEHQLENIANTGIDKDGQISVESYTKDSAKNFIGTNDLEIDSIDVSTESLKEYGVIDDVNNPDLDANIKLKGSDESKLIITDDVSILAGSSVVLDEVSNEANNNIYNNEDQTDETVLEKLNNLYKSVEYEKNDLIVLKNNDEITNNGVPLRIKLDSSSTIPVHLKGQPSKHLGYFIVLDDLGNPVTSDRLKDNSDEIQKLLVDNNVATDTRGAASINRAKQAILGFKGADVKLDNLEKIYNNLIESKLSTVLDKGMYKNLHELPDHSDFYSIILSRILSKKKTKLLFIPKEQVIYYAFEHRANGTGKSLMEKATILYSIKAMLLFTRLMASIKNNTTTTNVTGEIPEDDIDPAGTRKMIMDHILKTRQTTLPIGMYRLEHMVDWIHNLGFKFDLKNPNLPNLEINVDENNTNKVIPDTDLEDKIDEFIYMLYGVNPNLIRSGYDADYATTENAKSLLHAKKSEMLQDILTPQLTRHVSVIMRADGNIINMIKNKLRSNWESLSSYFNWEEKVEKSSTNNKDDDTDNDTIKDDDSTTNDEDEKLKEEFINMLTYKIVDEINVDLPDIESTDSSAMNEAFTSYIDRIESALDYLITYDSMPDELLGSFSNDIEKLREVFKSMLIRRWLLDNNYMPELSEIGLIDDENKSMSPIFNDYINYLNGIASMSEENYPKLKEIRSKFDKITSKFEEDNDSGNTSNNNNNNDRNSSTYW